MRPLDSIITALDARQFNLPEQIANVKTWKKSTGKLYVSSNQSLLEHKEIDWDTDKNACPYIRDMFSKHLFRMRGIEAVGIGIPGITLSEDFSPVFNAISQYRMEMAWAFYIRTSSSVYPKFYVVSTAVIHHLLNDVPQSLTMSGTDWSQWIHEKLSSIMQPNRYGDLSGLGLVKDVEQPKAVVFEPVKAIPEAFEPPVVVSIPPEPQNPVKALETAKAVKRKPGRTKQNAKAIRTPIDGETL